MHKNIVIFKFKKLYSKFVNITIRNFNKLVNMGIGLDITIDELLVELQIDEIIYYLHYNVHYVNRHYF
jgi:hypothetical protein